MGDPLCRLGAAGGTRVSLDCLGFEGSLARLGLRLVDACERGPSGGIFFICVSN